MHIHAAIRSIGGNRDDANSSAVRAPDDPARSRKSGLRLGTAAIVAVCSVLAASAVAQPQVRTGRTAGGIAYDVRGAGPAVVLFSGANLDRRMWAREAEWLSKNHTVVRYDLRAHGESETASAPFAHLDDLAGVLDELKLSNASLVGLSAGSVVALDAALAYPDRIERVVLAAPGMSGYVPRERPAFAADLIAALKVRDYAKAGEVLLATPVFAVPPESQSLVRQMVMDNDRLWSVPPGFVKQPERPAIEQLEQVKVPTLVLIGEKDVLQREQADLLAKRIPGAKLVTIPGGGHLLNLTSPAEFQREVSAFLR
jgi:3-oxoadipate enol-lactonase